MALSISADDVRNRARPLSAVELPDSLLASPPYIPAAVAQATALLESAGLDYDTLSESLQKVAQAIAIAICCKTIAVSMPTRGLRAGAVEYEPMAATDKEIVAKELDAEIRQLCGTLGVPLEAASIGGTGGENYEATDAE